MLASQAASQFSGSVQKLAGVSSLQIDPLIGGNNENPSARLALQQRLTKNFLFTFSTDVTQPGQEIAQGDYQISKHWSLSVNVTRWVESPSTAGSIRNSDPARRTVALGRISLRGTSSLLPRRLLPGGNLSHAALFRELRIKFGAD